MPEWQGHNQSDKLLRVGIAASYVPRFYFMSHVLRIAGQSERSLLPRVGH